MTEKNTWKDRNYSMVVPRRSEIYMNKYFVPSNMIAEQYRKESKGVHKCLGGVNKSKKFT